MKARESRHWTFPSYVLVACILALLLLQKQLWFSSSGLWSIHVLNVKIAEAQEFNAKLQLRNQKVLERVVQLKSGDEGVETRARTELGMIKQGEVFYQIVDS